MNTQHDRPPALTALRFSTADFSGADRVEAWRELFGRAVCQCVIEPIADAEFRSDVVLRALPGLGIASGTCSGAHYARTASMISNDDLLFIINHSGTDRAHLGSRDALVNPGEAVLMTTGEACSVTNKAATRFTTIRIPRAPIATAVAGIEAAMAKPVAASNQALRLLLNYISVLEDIEASTDETAQTQIVANVHDLIAGALGAKRGAAEHARHRGFAAARLRAVKADVRRGIAGPLPSADELAARHGLSTRYLQMLFERDGSTLTQFVLLERLAAAHRLLRDEARRSEHIASIALSTGFNDVSYFNRMFRRQFGRTPSDVRESALT